MPILPPPAPDERPVSSADAPPVPSPRGSSRGRRRSRAERRRTAAVALGAVVVVAVVIGVVASRSGGGDHRAGIQPAGAAAGLQRLLDRTGGSGATTCPFGSIAAVSQRLTGQLKFPATLVDQPADVTGDGTAPRGIQCSAASADERIRNVSALYVYATEKPEGKYQDYLTGRLLKGIKSKVDKAVRFDGGQIYAFCITGTADAKAGCAADWVADKPADDLVIGIQAVLVGMTAQQATAALERELAGLGAQLGGGVSTTTTTPTTTTPTTTTRSKVTTTG